METGAAQSWSPFYLLMHELGIDPIHFGVVMVLNLMIGSLHRVGVCLYVIANADISFERTVRATALIIPLLIVL